jgi:hypothetical protein
VIQAVIVTLFSYLSSFVDQVTETDCFKVHFSVASSTGSLLISRMAIDWYNSSDSSTCGVSDRLRIKAAYEWTHS